MYSLDTFLKVKSINKIVLVVPPHLINNFKKHIHSSKVLICLGNTKARYLSLQNGIKFLDKQVKLLPNDIIVTHDVARPNVTVEIIKQNIATCIKHNFASTLSPLVDSLCEINATSKYIDRTGKYLVQTPQTIKYRQ
jgi:2-C-methyl-D-erythritol 4-phosphate cytidylyltransferase